MFPNITLRIGLWSQHNLVPKGQSLTGTLSEVKNTLLYFQNRIPIIYEANRIRGLKTGLESGWLDMMEPSIGDPDSFGKNVSGDIVKDFETCVIYSKKEKIRRNIEDVRDLVSIDRDVLAYSLIFVLLGILLTVITSHSRLRMVIKSLSTTLTGLRESTNAGERDLFGGITLRQPFLLAIVVSILWAALINWSLISANMVVTLKKSDTFDRLDMLSTWNFKNIEIRSYRCELTKNDPHSFRFFNSTAYRKAKIIKYEQKDSNAAKGLAKEPPGQHLTVSYSSSYTLIEAYACEFYPEHFNEYPLHRSEPFMESHLRLIHSRNIEPKKIKFIQKYGRRILEMGFQIKAYRPDASKAYWDKDCLVKRPEKFGYRKIDLALIQPIARMVLLSALLSLIVYVISTLPIVGGKVETLKIDAGQFMDTSVVEIPDRPECSDLADQNIPSSSNFMATRTGKVSGIQ